MNLSVGRKGYVMTWDSIIALIFLLIIFMGIISLQYFRSITVRGTTFLELQSLSTNAMDGMDKSGTLDQALLYWAQGNLQMLNRTVGLYLNESVPQHISYRFLVEDQILHYKIRIPESKASDITVARRRLSGYALNKGGYEFVSRAWLLYNDAESNKSYSIANVSYGNSFRNSDGASWVVEHIEESEGPANSTFSVPLDYSGERVHNYTKPTGCPPPLDDDSINDAIYRLLHYIDVSPANCMIENVGPPIRLNLSKMSFQEETMPTNSIKDRVEVSLIVWI